MAAIAALAMRMASAGRMSAVYAGGSTIFARCTLMAGVLFVLNALVTKALVSWAQGLLASETMPSLFARLGNAY